MAVCKLQYMFAAASFGGRQLQLRRWQSLLSVNDREGENAIPSKPQWGKVFQPSKASSECGTIHRLGGQTDSYKCDFNAVSQTVKNGFSGMIANLEGFTSLK